MSYARDWELVPNPPRPVHVATAIDVFSTAVDCWDTADAAEADGDGRLAWALRNEAQRACDQRLVLISEFWDRDEFDGMALSEVGRDG